MTIKLLFSEGGVGGVLRCNIQLLSYVILWRALDRMVTCLACVTVYYYCIDVIKKANIDIDIYNMYG